jgi:hypothetical protein
MTNPSSNAVEPNLLKENSTVPWSDLMNKLEKWAGLPVGWDGEDGVAPNQHATDNAQQFLTMLYEHEIKVDKMQVSGDGDITFTWDKNNRLAVVSFLNDGNILIAGGLNGEYKPMEVDAPMSSNWDRNHLLMILKQYV